MLQFILQTITQFVQNYMVSLFFLKFMIDFNSMSTH